MSALQVPKRKVWIAVGFGPGGFSNLEVPVGLDSLVVTFHDEPCVVVVAYRREFLVQRCPENRGEITPACLCQRHPVVEATQTPDGRC